MFSLKNAVKSASHPFLNGNFAPVNEEVTILDLPVEGNIPEELSGRLVRIGPNPIQPNPSSYHWFIGTGMVHGLRLKDGGAKWYRNRYVMNKEVAKVSGKKDLTGPKRPFSDGNVNTNVLAIGGELFALVEAGSLPVQLDYELQSKARSDFGGTLKSAFTAHPRRDPESGNLHVVAYNPGQPNLKYLIANNKGQARNIVDIPAPHGPMIHDVAITKSQLILLDLSITFNMVAAINSPFPYIWNSRQHPRLGLLPLTGEIEKMQWFEAPSCAVFHIMNAYESDDKVFVDVVKHTKVFDAQKLGPSEGNPMLFRWTLDRVSGQLKESQLYDRALEFPRLNDAFMAREYRFGYTCEFNNKPDFGFSFKHDLFNGRTYVHDYGPGRAAMEPVFVAKEGARAEDDGWIMSYVFDKNTNRTDIVILDAKNFEAEPIATIHLPVRVPYGFHGNWIADNQII